MANVVSRVHAVYMRRYTVVTRTNKHNARRGFLNRCRSICTVISVHVRLHTCASYTYEHRGPSTTCVLALYILAWIPQCIHSLPPRSTGQWLDALICFASLCFIPPLFLHPLYPSPQSIVSSPHTMPWL